MAIILWFTLLLEKMRILKVLFFYQKKKKVEVEEEVICWWFKTLHANCWVKMTGWNWGEHSHIQRYVMWGSSDCLFQLNPHPKSPSNYALSPKGPTVFEILTNNYKFVNPKTPYSEIFDWKWQICLQNIFLFFFYKFPSKFMINTVVLEFFHQRTPLFV